MHGFLFLRCTSHERARTTKPGCDERGGGGARLLRGASLSAACRRPREVSGLAGPAKAPCGISPALAFTDPSRKTSPSWSRAAGPRRRPSTRCAGRRRESPASTSAKPACAAPRSSSGSTSWTISRCASFPSSGQANWRRASTRSSAPASSTIWRTPMRGCAPCATCSTPDGAMNLMVYAPYGRTGIYMLQDFCRRIGISATDVEIRDLIAALKALPPGHPLQNLLRDAPDFRQRGGARRRAAAPLRSRVLGSAVIRFLDRAGLTFGRWVRQAAYSPRCGVMAQLPQASRIQQLAAEDQYAATELFRGTMVRHSVIAYRDDAPWQRSSRSVLPATRG